MDNNCFLWRWWDGLNFPRVWGASGRHQILSDVGHSPSEIYPMGIHIVCKYIIYYITSRHVRRITANVRKGTGFNIFRYPRTYTIHTNTIPPSRFITKRTDYELTIDAFNCQRRAYITHCREKRPKKWTPNEKKKRQVS